MPARYFVALLLAALAAIAVPAAAAPARTSSPEISLAVDARDVGRRLLHVRQSVPAAPGVLALSYPEWIPGNTAPRDRSSRS